MRRLTGSILVMIAAIGFGFMGLFRSWASELSVEMTLFLRFAIAGAIMAAITILRGDRWPRGGVLAGLIAMGAILYVAESMSFFHAMRHIPSGLVSLLLYVYPVIVTIGAWLFLHERLTTSKLLALALAVGGMAITIGPIAIAQWRAGAEAGGNRVLGVALGLGCCASYAIYILVGRNPTRRAGAIPASTIVILSAAVVFGVMALGRGDAMPMKTGAWVGVLGLTIVSTVIAITGILVGLERIGAVQTSTLSTLEPITTVIVGAMLLHEPLGVVQIIGGCLIVAAAVIVARSAAASTESTSEDTEHTARELV